MSKREAAEGVLERRRERGECKKEMMGFAFFLLVLRWRVKKEGLGGEGSQKDVRYQKHCAESPRNGIGSTAKEVVQHVRRGSKKGRGGVKTKVQKDGSKKVQEERGQKREGGEKKSQQKGGSGVQKQVRCVCCVVCVLCVEVGA